MKSKSRGDGVESNGRIGEDNKTVDEWLQLGRRKLMQMNYQGALEAFDEALEMDPQNTWALNNRGSVYLQLQQMDRALENFEMALEVDPDFTAAEYGKALVYNSQNKTSEAITSFEKFLANPPANHQQQVQFAQQALENLKNQKPVHVLFGDPSNLTTEQAELLKKFNQGNLQPQDFGYKPYHVRSTTGNISTRELLDNPLLLFSLAGGIAGIIGGVIYNAVFKSPDFTIGNTAYFYGGFADMDMLGLFGSMMVMVIALFGFYIVSPKIIGIIILVWAIFLVIGSFYWLGLTGLYSYLPLSYLELEEFMDWV